MNAATLPLRTDVISLRLPIEAGFAHPFRIDHAIYLPFQFPLVLMERRFAKGGDYALTVASPSES